MALEIERRFLVASHAWPAPEAVRHIRQAYLGGDGQLAVRIRACDDRYVLSLKSALAPGVRHEFEVDVPAQTAEDMFRHLSARPPIEKKRHLVRDGERLWEIDVFGGENEGMIIAEVELPSLDTPLALPVWIGREITHDPRFSNNALYRHPFRLWGVSYRDLAA